MKIHLLRIILIAFLITPLYRQGTDGFVNIFNGKDLTGWKTTGNWVIKENNILTLKPREGESEWKRCGAYITTEKLYSDFILDLDLSQSAIKDRRAKDHIGFQDEA